MKFNPGDVVYYTGLRKLTIEGHKLDPNSKGVVLSDESTGNYYDAYYLVKFENENRWCLFGDELTNNYTLLNGEISIPPISVRFKKLVPEAVTPSYAKPGDAGLDITAIDKSYDTVNDLVVFNTGLAFEIPEGYVGLLFPRSSVSKTPLSLANSVGVIDAGYRGEVKFMFRPGDRPRKNYEIGDRVGQLVILPFPRISLVESAELSSTERGTGGIGSTGK